MHQPPTPDFRMYGTYEVWITLVYSFTQNQMYLYIDALHWHIYLYITEPGLVCSQPDNSRLLEWGSYIYINLEWVHYWKCPQNRTVFRYCNISYDIHMLWYLWFILFELTDWLTDTSAYSIHSSRSANINVTNKTNTQHVWVPTSGGRPGRWRQWAEGPCSPSSWCSSWQTQPSPHTGRCLVSCGKIVYINQLSHATSLSSTCQSHSRMHLVGNHQVEGEVPDDGLC